MAAEALARRSHQRPPRACRAFPSTSRPPTSSRRWAARRRHPCVGPFQGQDYRVAEACIRTGAHYIVLADGRQFVAGIGILNDAATAAGVLVTGGASSVPALSSAAVDRLVEGMREVRAIDVGISPGNRTERGLSTVQSILSYCGQPIAGTHGEVATGWGSTYHHTYPTPVGSRAAVAVRRPRSEPASCTLRRHTPHSLRRWVGVEVPA